jgi:predicted S18 family serine protease
MLTKKKVLAGALMAAALVLMIMSSPVTAHKNDCVSAGSGGPGYGYTAQHQVQNHYGYGYSINE